MIKQVFMKRNLKKVISLCLIFTIMSLMGNITNAEVQTPTQIRIGLHYADAATGVNTALSCFNVSAQEGLQIGFIGNNVFNQLFEEPTSNLVTIRKDAYFTNNNGVQKEYNPLSAVVPEGVKLGSFHIQIGANYNDLNEVSQQVQALKLLGISAYPVYIDQWQVWTGFYIDLNAAQNDLATNIQPKLSPDVGYTFIQPTQNRIVVLSKTGEVGLVFGSSVNKFLIHPKQENNPNILKINNKSCYRGDLEVRRFTGSDMTVVNVISLDQYLYGVVPSEIGASSHPEALKAQALAAKTYALSGMGKHGKIGFDVCPTIHCQVYKGYGAEAPESNKAIDDMTGKKITYQGKLALTCFFASSGGATEDVKNVWGSNYPYLISVEDKYESGKSYNYNWVVTKTASSIGQILQGRSSNIGDVLSVQIAKNSDSGRVTELVMTGTKGSKTYLRESTRTVLGFSSQLYTITTDADSYLLGANQTKVKEQLGSKKVITANGLSQVKTLNNSVVVIGANGVKKSIPIVPQNYIFTGKGWGHAVGLSQEGARGMAKAGFTYDQIIKHYYQGVMIE
jgi:stage II sporulation protein D